MSSHHSPNALPHCRNLQAQVDSVLSLLQQEPTLGFVKLSDSLAGTTCLQNAA
jgi:hypothetical protein